MPAARVMTVPEALTSAHVRARELVHELPFAPARGGHIRVLGAGVRVDGEALVPDRPPPLLGEHTDAVLAEAGLTTGDVAALRRASAA